MECYFEPLLPGGCPADEYKRQQRAFHHPQANPPGEPDCKLGTKCLDVSDLYAVPPAFKQRGIFWWRAVQTAHVTRINAGTAALLDLAAVKRQIGYEHPIIGASWGARRLGVGPTSRPCSAFACRRNVENRVAGVGPATSGRRSTAKRTTAHESTAQADKLTRVSFLFF